MALKSVYQRAAPSSNWLKTTENYIRISLSGNPMLRARFLIDHWILLHLDTLLPPQPHLPPEDVRMLEWSDTPAKVHIASARLDLYDSLAKAEHDRPKGPMPAPELLRVFLWSKDHGVCCRAFKWCLDLVPICQPSTPGEVNSTRMFTPETMGYEWIGHFIHVICKGEYLDMVVSWELLILCLFPKWTMLSSSWRHEFASGLLFTVVRSLGMDGLPAYQFLATSSGSMSFDQQQAFFPFLATLLELVKSNLTWATLISLESWLAQLPECPENQARIKGILATRKQQLSEENLVFFAELPMAVEWLEETLELFGELPMADE